MYQSPQERRRERAANLLAVIATFGIFLAAVAIVAGR